MSLDELLRTMGCCDTMRRAIVGWNDGSVDRAAGWMLRNAISPPDYTTHASMQWFYAHMERLPYGALCACMDAIDRAGRGLRGAGSASDNLHLDTALDALWVRFGQLEERHLLIWADAMGTRGCA